MADTAVGPSFGTELKVRGRFPSSKLSDAFQLTTIAVQDAFKPVNAWVGKHYQVTLRLLSGALRPIPQSSR